MQSTTMLQAGVYHDVEPHAWNILEYRHQDQTPIKGRWRDWV